MLFPAVAVNAQWVRINGPFGNNVSCFAVSGTNLYAGANNGIFVSTDNGTSWTEINTGSNTMNVNALTVSGMNIYAGAWGHHFYFSTNNGANWTEACNFPININIGNIFALAVIDQISLPQLIKAFSVPQIMV